MGKKQRRTLLPLYTAAEVKAQSGVSFPHVQNKVRFAFSDHACCCPPQRAGLLLWQTRPLLSDPQLSPAGHTQGSTKPLLGLTPLSTSITDVVNTLQWKLRQTATHRPCHLPKHFSFCTTSLLKNLRLPVKI